MKATDHVDLSDTQFHRRLHLGNDFLRGMLEAIGIPHFSSKRAEFAAEYAVVGIVNVTVDDIAGALPDLLLSREICNRPNRVQVLALEQTQRLRFGDPFAGGDFLVDLAMLTALHEKLHALANVFGFV